MGASAIAATYGPYNNFDQHVYYSPGLCPSGWNSNAAGTSGSETTAFCCGPGFAAVTSPGVIGGLQTKSTLCSSDVGSTVITTIAYTGDGAKEGSTQVFTYSNVQIPAPAVWIRYKEADFAGAATTTGGAAKSTTTTGTSPSATGSSSI